MAFIPWACLLSACFSVSLADVVSLTELFHPLWKQSPSQISDYTVENGVYLINPWVFPESMGLYKILWRQTAHYFEEKGIPNKDNFLAALAVEYGWVYSSGRLADPTKRTDCGYESGDPFCISVDSWWSDVYYIHSVLPFLAAVDSGIMQVSSDQVKLLPAPKDQMMFCNDVSTCHVAFPKIMEAWNDFYQQLKLPSSSFEDLSKYFWDACILTGVEAAKLFEDRLEYYSKEEADFARGFVVLQRYLSAAGFPPTLSAMHKSLKFLPPRLLVDGDIVPFISDFTTLQNGFLLAINLLYDIDYDTGSLSLTAWEILMNTKEARELLGRLVELIVAALL